MTLEELKAKLERENEAADAAWAAWLARWDLRFSHGMWTLNGTRPGWYPIINRLVSDLITMGWNRELWEVKDRFGWLQFRTTSWTNGALRARIDEAEQESSRICSRCGAPGQPWDDGTANCRTLCTGCEMEHQGRTRILEAARRPAP